MGAGAALVPLNTRFKGPEAAYVLTRSRARALFTVRGFLGIDYPAMLEDEDVPHLERIVLLRDDEGTTSEVTKTDEVPIFGWHEFLAGADGVVECDEGVVGAPVDVRAERARWQSVTGDDLSDVIFTSGTTGRPKGAMTTHAQTLRTFATWASIVGLAEGDRYLVVNPFFHTFGYKAGIIACLMQGATIVPEPVFDVDKVLATVAAERITVLPGPPTLYQSILDHPRRADYDLSSLRLAVTGAAVVPVELVKRMRSELTFSTVLTAYGLTESTGTVTMCRQGDDPETIAQTSGRAIPGLEVRVVDDDGVELARGEPGEIVVRGYTVVVGLLRGPRGHRRGHRRRGVAAHRRHRGHGRRRQRPHHRPQEGHVHRGRLQRLPGRDRGGPAPPPGRGPGGGDRRPRRPHGRGGLRLRGAPARRRRRPPWARSSWPGPGTRWPITRCPATSRWSTPCPPTPVARY